MTEPDLRAWMPSAAGEQQDADAFVAACHDAFDAGTTYAYAVIDGDGEVAGYANVTPDAGVATVAYWIRSDARRQGLASAAVGALGDAAFAAWPAVGRVQAHVDAANAASQGVLAKAGFLLASSTMRPPRTPAESDTELVLARPRTRTGPVSSVG